MKKVANSKNRGHLLSKKLFNVRTIPIIAAFFVILLSIGYSAFGTNLNITGITAEVRIEADIRVTGIAVESYTNDAVSTYEDYNVSNISMGANLPNSNSSITYKISVTNFGNAEMGILAINNLPSNLEYELSGYTLQDKICVSNQCSLGIVKEFYITIKYADNGYDSSNTVYPLSLDIDFRPFHTVTYEGFTSTSGYPNDVIDGGTLETTFYGYVPNIEVKMGGSTLARNLYTFNPDTYYLMVPNVTDNLTVTYKEATLISLLYNDYTEGSTTGLVQDETDSDVYYFTGDNDEVNNNYFWYGGHHWRVLEFDTSNNTVLLISQQPLTSIQPASATWTSQSAYENSYINSWLNDYFYNSLSSSVKNNIVNNTFNVGIYSNVDEITTTQKVGLLDVEQYERAGGADSYLHIKNWFWLGNRSNSSYVRYINQHGGYNGGRPIGSNNGVRPVIRINDVEITGGDGTLTSNYKTSSRSTSTSNVQVGEYINVPYNGSDGACGSDKMCTFRVVSKDSDSIKVILNGLLPSTSVYGSDSTITTSHTIYTPLNTFANNISTNYRYAGSNKTFYIGDYPSGSSYTDVQDEILYATVGLPTVGEMFSGNDIDMSTSSTKDFVNVSTIENPTVNDYYWTMNRDDTSSVYAVYTLGNVRSYSLSSSYGVRPVILLKLDIAFDGGDGTAENPYELEPVPTIISSLLEQYNEGATTGLVQDSTDSNVYYFTGNNSQVSNNYLWYGGHHWRVIEFDTSDNTLLLISTQPLTTISPASSAWTTQSAYESSYINSWLNDYFYNSLDSSVKNNIVNNTFNIGIYNDVDEITTTQKVGLLDEDQYTRAGTASSYLNIADYFWLGNRYSSSYVRYVDSNGYLNYNGPSYSYGVRPVIRISDLTITGGNGTLTSNYEVETKATNTNNVQVGEYINVSYNGSDGACGSDNLCTFRVVSKDSDSIKVILNGLLPSDSAYGSSSTITTSHTIYTPLNTFANNISTNYRYAGSNKVFYIGDYPDGSNYTAVQDEILYATVGLPTVGEMFSGNDIDMSLFNSKTFVNVSTIENPKVTTYYWFMNRYNSPNVRVVHHYGYLYGYVPSNKSGVRPVIYLKSGTSALTFTGGKGTAESPYELQ